MVAHHSSPPTRPVLRYHGGKWRIAPWIIKHFPEHKIYVEPYGGAGSVLIRKPRSFSEVWNDLDGDVVTLFRVLRDPVKSARLAELLEFTPWAREEFSNSYEPTVDDTERARRLIVRCYMGFGTTTRRKNMTGFRGEGRRRNGSECACWPRFHEQIPLFARRLQGVVIECLPALDLIRRKDTPETLFYLDPPYVMETRSSARGRVANDHSYIVNLTDEDHQALAALLSSIDGMAIVSGYRCPMYDALFDGWRRVEKAAFADGSVSRAECLWISPRSQRADLFNPHR